MAATTSFCARPRTAKTMLPPVYEAGMSGLRMSSTPLDSNCSGTATGRHSFTSCRSSDISIPGISQITVALTHACRSRSVTA